MTYEVGQKVETPFGICKVTDVNGLLVKVEHAGTLSEFELPIGMLSPYKTADEKLIEMEYYYVRGYENYLLYAKGVNAVIIHPRSKTYTTNFDITLELSRILTQYLEELNEK